MCGSFGEQPAAQNDFTQLKMALVIVWVVLLRVVPIQFTNLLCLCSTASSNGMGPQIHYLVPHRPLATTGQIATRMARRLVLAIVQLALVAATG